MNKIGLLGSITVTLLATSCLRMQKPPEQIFSPSQKFMLEYALNKDGDKSKKNCVYLKLYTNDYKVLDSLQTSASNTMKWAVSWHPTHDTVIVNSTDIGVQAYTIHESKLQAIPVNDDLHKVAAQMFEGKYPN